MANTLQNLFPFTENRAEDYVVDPVCVMFAAPVVGGKYVFNDVLTPPQVFGELLQKQKGIIAGVMISANCSPADFAAAVENPLKLQILHDGNMTPVNMSPFPFSTFSDGDNFQQQWKATGTNSQQSENFLLQVSGEVNQLQGMSQNELILKVSFNYIRVGIDKLKG